MKRKQCPDCPDGYVWTTSGQTDDACSTCGGTAWVPDVEPYDNADLLEWYNSLPTGATLPKSLVDWTK